MSEIPAGPGLGGRQTPIDYSSRFREGRRGRALRAVTQELSLAQEPSDNLFLFAPRTEASQRAVSDDDVFARLVKDWKAASSMISSVAEMSMLPEYQQIIGMGRRALPLILAVLEREADPDHWFWALKAIAREDPVPPEARGNLRAMADAWIKWGRESGVLALRSAH